MESDKDLKFTGFFGRTRRAAERELAEFAKSHTIVKAEYEYNSNMRYGYQHVIWIGYTNKEDPMTDIVEWVEKEFGITLMEHQKEFLRKSYEAHCRGEQRIWRKGMPVYRYIRARCCGKRALVTIIDEETKEEPNES